MAHYRIKELGTEPFPQDVTAPTLASALREYANDQHIKILDAKCIHAEDEKVVHYYKFEDTKGNVYTRTITETEDAQALKGKKRR